MRGELALLRADPAFTGIEQEEDPSALGRNHPEQIHRIFFRWEPEDPALLRIRENRLYFEVLPTALGTPTLPMTPEFRESLLTRLIQNQEESVDGSITPELQESLINRVLHDPETSELRHRLGLAMAQPLRSRIDYQATARRTFLVEQLPEGSLPVYDRDPEVGAAPRRITFNDEGRDANGSPVSDDPPLRFRRVRQGQDPFELPPWVQPGVWVWFKQDHERISRIVAVEDEGKYIRIHNWRRQPEEEVVSAEWLVQFREQCPTPKEPIPRFDRVLKEDFLANLTPKMATVLIDGKASFITRLGRKVLQLVRGGLPVLYNLGIDSIDRSPTQTNRFDRIDADDEPRK